MKGATPYEGDPRSGLRPVTTSDSTILALLIPALDGPTPPKREWWQKTFSRTEEEIDALFTLAHFERDKWGAELAALKERPEAEADAA